MSRRGRRAVIAGGLTISLLGVASAGFLFGTRPGQQWRLNRAGTADLLVFALSHPNDGAAQRLLAERLLAENRPDNAVNAFAAWARAEPNAAAPLAGQGSALLRAGRPADALAPLEEAARREPDNPAALTGLGEAYYALGNAEAARRYLSRALQKAPRADDAWADLAFALTDLRQHAAAQEAAERAVRLAPDAGLAHAALGYARDASGDTAGAITALERATRLDPRNGRFWEMRGAVQARAARTPAEFVAAHAVLDTTGALLPDSSRVPYYRGLLLLAERRYDQAAVAFGVALERAPRFTDALYNRSVALTFAGRASESARVRARFERARAYDRERTHLELRLSRDLADAALWRRMLRLATDHGDRDRARLARLRLSALLTSPPGPAAASE